MGIAQQLLRDNDSIVDRLSIAQALGLNCMDVWYDSCLCFVLFKDFFKLLPFTQGLKEDLRGNLLFGCSKLLQPLRVINIINHLYVPYCALCLKIYLKYDVLAIQIPFVPICKHADTLSILANYILYMFNIKMYLNANTFRNFTTSLAFKHVFKVEAGKCLRKCPIPRHCIWCLWPLKYRKLFIM